GVVLGSVFRVGREDLAALTIATSDGSLSTPRYLGPRGDAGSLKVAWTGERVIALRLLRDGLTRRGFSVQAVDLEGELLDEIEVELSSGYGFELAVSEEAIAVVVNVVQPERELWEMRLFTLAHDGSLLMPPRTLTSTPYSNAFRLVGVPGGWLLVLPGGRGEPAELQHLSPEGELLRSGPLGDGIVLGGSGRDDDFRAEPGTGRVAAVWQDQEIAAQLHVALLDSEGMLTHDWSGPLDPSPGSEGPFITTPSITFAGGRLLVSWVEIAPDETPNRVLVREFGCID
ncbi:MAG: hypothetical protein OEY14_14310, partial [Myxococcales bacterium]|nr:hypothetical protein [Myxococcales bacterium]